MAFIWDPADPQFRIKHAILSDPSKIPTTVRDERGLVTTFSKISGRAPGKKFVREYTYDQSGSVVTVSERIEDL